MTATGIMTSNAIGPYCAAPSLLVSLFGAVVGALVGTLVAALVGGLLGPMPAMLILVSFLAPLQPSV